MLSFLCMYVRSAIPDDLVELIIEECDESEMTCIIQYASMCRMVWGDSWNQSTCGTYMGFDDICLDELCDRVCKKEHFFWCKGFTVTEIITLVIAVIAIITLAVFIIYCCCCYNGCCCNGCCCLYLTQCCLDTTKKPRTEFTYSP
jgi:hypothetical protein